ncbi:MAG: response regulator transcription factor [Planctomycetota bacterium]
MARRKILVIEDDHAIRRGVVDALRVAGYDTLEAERADTGLDLALHREYDLLLLDLVLPRGDGLEILRMVRAARPTTPVIILTARGEEHDRLAGFQLGADDYVIKPFSVKELLARVTAVLRRSPERPLDMPEVSFAGGVANLSSGEISFDDGEQTTLSEREGELLRYLAVNSGRAVSRDEILSRVWRVDPQGIETRTIDMHVARLREKLRDHSGQPRIVVTVRGKGYRFLGAEDGS